MFKFNTKISYKISIDTGYLFKLAKNDKQNYNIVIIIFVLD